MQRPPAFVNFHVTYKVVLLYKILGAKVALETSLAGVDADVQVPASLPRKTLAAVVAFVWALARMLSLVSLHGTPECCRIAAHRTPQHTHPILRAR